MTDETQTTDSTPPPEEVEREARGMGWQPKEQWKGAPEKWVDAAEFVKRGETFVPFLQHQRKLLKGEVEQTNARLAQVQAELQETRKTLEDLTTFNQTMAKDRQERRKAEIGAELKAAREAGDDVRVAELQNELGEVVKPAPAPKSNGAAAPAQPVIMPWVKNFLEGNKEFFESPRKVALFNAIMIERRSAGDKRVGEGDGTALLDEVRTEVENALGGNPARRAPARSEDSRPTGGGGGGGNRGAKTYFDMPPDAQAKCDSQEARFVGKGFKDQAAWRKHFVGEYFGPSAIQVSRGE